MKHCLDLAHRVDADDALPKNKNEDFTTIITSQSDGESRRLFTRDCTLIAAA